MKTSIFKTIIAGCFALMGSAVFAQDAVQDKEVADKACDCTKDIDGTLPKEALIKEINSCISSSKLLISLTSVNKESEEAKKNGNDTKKEYNITFNVDEVYTAILAIMNNSCENMKMLMAASVGDVISTDPAAKSYYDEARNYTEQQKFDEAIESYKKAIKADPKFATAWAYMGLNYRRLNDYKQAIACYDKALSLNPDSIIALQNKAISYELLEDLKNAAATYEKFIKLHPESPEGYYGAGHTFYSLEKYEKGVDYMFKAYLKYQQAQSPYFADAQKNIGTYYKDLKQKNKLDVFMQAAKNNNIELK